MTEVGDILNMLVFVTADFVCKSHWCLLLLAPSCRESGSINALQVTFLLL